MHGTKGPLADRIFKLHIMTIAPYRGGWPELIYAAERILNKAAHQLGQI
jgi:hypothetical protein